MRRLEGPQAACSATHTAKPTLAGPFLTGPARRPRAARVDHAGPAPALQKAQRIRAGVLQARRRVLAQQHLPLRVDPDSGRWAGADPSQADGSAAAGPAGQAASWTVLRVAARARAGGSGQPDE